ncbi:MAG: hypothetical protein H0X71_05210 [Rubrobacter sp.]|nr:hypothetical protein [Rubrobacter sp.]
MRTGVMTREQSEEQVARCFRHWKEQGFGLWAVEDKATGAFIGFVGLLYHDDWSNTTAAFRAASFSGSGSGCLSGVF